ncbi:MAG: aldehyde dehydrogenase family protein, partial [Planctomycetota bacterium]
MVDTVAEAETSTSASPRLNVLKTYKLYIGGKFPRTESGRYYKLENNGETLANLCLSSRKDFRNAVVAARSAQSGWAKSSAFLKSQILYRIAEML